MELKEAIDKLFEMTDEQRLGVFGLKTVESVLNYYSTDSILKNIEDYYSEPPKYGDVYVGKDGWKVIVLSGGFTLCEEYECPQEMSVEYVAEHFIKTGKNVADKLKGLFE